MWLQVSGTHQNIEVVTGGFSDRTEGLGGATLDGVEWEALVLGVESERFWAGDLCAVAAAKRADPARRLTADEALSGAQPERSAPWSVAEVLARLGATLLRVDLAEEQSPRDSIRPAA